MFRDLIENTTTDRIELSDAELEKAETLTDLLDAITKAEYVTAPNHRERNLRLVSLCQKYSFDNVLAHIALHYKSQLNNTPEVTFAAFSIGVEMNDLALCKWALKSRARSLLDPSHDAAHTFGQSRVGTRTLDPAS